MINHQAAVAAPSLAAPSLAMGAPQTTPQTPPQTHEAALFSSHEWREWLDGKRSPHTQRMYAVALRDFTRFLAQAGVTSWREISVPLLTRYPAYLRHAGYKPASQQQKLTAARVALRYAVALDLLDSRFLGVADTLKGDPTPNVSPRYPLTRAQMKQLLNAPDPQTRKGARDRAILAVAAFLALRNFEMCDIQLGWFHRVGDHLVIRVTGKGGSVEELPVRPVVSAAMRAWLVADGRPVDDLANVEEARRCEPVFTPFRPYHVGAAKARDSKTGARFALSPRGLRGTVARYAKQCGIKTDVHTLRMTAATTAIEGGADLWDVKEFLRHADVRTTQRYIKRVRSLDASATYKVHYD